MIEELVTPSNLENTISWKDKLILDLTDDVANLELIAYNKGMI